MNSIFAQSTIPFASDMNSYDTERIADLKSTVEYQKRMIKRLQEENKVLEQTVEKEMAMIDVINNMFATTRASTCCTNQQSIIFQTLTNENSPPKPENDETQSDISEPPGNLYRHPSTDEILYSLRKAIDFQEFFYDYPLGFIALYDSSPIQFDTDAIILEVETWPPERRIDFFAAFFEHLNAAAFFFISLLSLVDSQTIPMMSEYIETGLSSILNCNRVAFFFYEPETNELVMEKQRLQMRRQMKSGIIYESLKKNKQSLISRGFSNFSKDDDALLKENQIMLSIPIYSDGVPKALILLYDKIGGFRRIDFLVGNALSRFIAQTIPIITQRQDRKQCIDMFQNSLDTFLQLVSAQDISTFNKVIPATFSQHFQCEYIKVYKISKDMQTFTLVTEDKEKREAYPINLGIIGQSISQRTPIRSTFPELSASFVAAVDRPDPSVFSRSMLVCPILDREGIPRFVISLFNKTGLDSFSELDLERLRMVCEYLNNILTSVLESRKLTMLVEHSRQKVSLYTTIFDMLSALSVPSDISKSIEIMETYAGQAFCNHTVDVYFVDKLNRFVCSYSKEFEDRLTINENDPIVKFTYASETKQAKAGEDSPSIIYSGMKDMSTEPIGLLKITSGKSNGNKFNIGSMFQSTLSVISGNSDGNSIKTTKSVVQIKVEKLNTIQASQYKDIRDVSLNQLITIWKNLLGPVIEITLRKTKMTQLINICDNLVGNLPSNPKIAVSVFKELQFALNSSETDENSSLIVLTKDDEYAQKTKNLIDSFSLMLSSSQTQTEYQTKSSLKGFGFSPEPSNDIATSPLFDAFSTRIDIFTGIIISVLTENGVLHYLSLDHDGALKLVNALKSMHTSGGFKSWDLVIDHFQFAAYLLKNLGNAIKMTGDQTASIFIYLMSLYCYPYNFDPEFSKEMMVKYYIENGQSFSPLASFIAAISMMNDTLINRSVIDELAPLLKQLEVSQTFDFMNSGEYFILIVNLCQYSYLVREQKIARKWIDMRFDEDCEGEDQATKEEIMKCQLDFEVRSILLPTCGEFVKRGIKFDHIRKMYTTTISNITGNAF